MSASSSIRFRLMAANILVKQVVILAAGLLLIHTFDRLIHQQASRELEAAAAQLAQSFRPSDSAGEEPVVTISDPRFAQPLSGRYWQIAYFGKPQLRSISLGSTFIDIAGVGFDVSGTPIRDLKGPAGQTLFAIAKTSNTSPNVTILTAMNNEELAELISQFRNYVVLALGGLAALLLTSAWIQVNVGLRPAEQLRNAIERIRLGHDRRISAGFPDELKPLIDETNNLLEAQELAVERARMRAGDLAHGLKTPLHAVSMLVSQLRDSGEMEAAGEIVKQIDVMNRHIHRELTKSRIAADAHLTFKTDLNSIIGRVVHTMERLPRGDDLDWVIDTVGDTTTMIEDADAIELLGNVLDNARKWARTAVTIRVHRSASLVSIEIADDGPGAPKSDHARILKRGIRLDESIPGTGLGLTIAKDIVDAYDGTISLFEAAEGGLGVRIELPAGQPAPPKQSVIGGANRESEDIGTTQSIIGPRPAVI